MAYTVHWMLHEWKIITVKPSRMLGKKEVPPSQPTPSLDIGSGDRGGHYALRPVLI